MVGIDLDEVELPLAEYPDLSSFFARRLRPGARPISENRREVVAPCDGRVSSTSDVRAGSLVQAKGRRYRLDALLADSRFADRLDGGSQITLYLSPADYHRVHSPVSGRLTRYTYLPGSLLPVGPLHTERVEDLFARNERMILEIETSFGPVALVLVGAAGVGNLRLAAPEVETRRFRRQRLTRTVTLEQPLMFERGDELGAFQLGSTVVLVFPRGAVKLRELGYGARVRCGDTIASIVSDALLEGHSVTAR
jgi:phosphatidylserine decarboxylase